ncbi:MAG: class I SAM-dependent methyltransferase [Balneolaceae bacterium]|nr:class I SAM-dependent methyltransferase [Balneolaceae bacterium]
MANQARKPTGWFGRIVAPLVFNHENKYMEDFGLERMDPAGDENILEIGFGQGRLLSRLLPQMTNGKVYGIDISGQMVQLTANNNESWIAGGKLELKQASIADIPYPDNRFDKVFTCNTIYFWPNPKENIREVKRVLHPNGEFYCAFRGRKLMESKGSAVTENRQVFQNLYRKDEVAALFEEGGFNAPELYSQSKGGETYHVVSGSA